MNKILIVLSLSILTSCTTKVGSIYRENNSPPVEINAKQLIINYVDKRDVDDGKVQIPFISFPSDHSQHEKKIEKKYLEALLDKTFVLNKKSKTNRIELTFHILKANQKFQANTFTETETVFALTKTHIKNCRKKVDKKSELTSIDASNENIDLMIYKQLVVNFKVGLKYCIEKK